MKLHDPKNTATYNKLYAFLSEDDLGNHGIIAAPIGLGDQLVPLVFGDKRNAEKLLSLAKQISAVTDKKVVLAVYNIESKEVIK